MSSINEITIVAGGWSATKVDLSKLRGKVIAVNDAARFLPVNPSIVVSMDRLWTEARWKWLCKRADLAWIRESALQNIGKWESDPVWLLRFGCDNTSTTMAERTDEYSLDTLNGTNSGMCALNLAYQMRPQTVYLVGFDMNRSAHGKPYWHAPYPWASYKGATSRRKYGEWSGQFIEASKQFKQANIDVFNVSTTSAICSFHKMSPETYASPQINEAIHPGHGVLRQPADARTASTTVGQPAAGYPRTAARNHRG